MSQPVVSLVDRGTSEPALAELLAVSASLHRHLCPRQVLGVRMGLHAGELLGIEVPQTGKRLYTIAETDGCAVDGISAATNCWVGRRTLRIEDLGKVAATFVDTETGGAIRVVPRGDVRRTAYDFAPEESGKWRAQLLGYQRMPADQLLRFEPVSLMTPLEKLISRPGMKSICSDCGEEVMNEREVVLDGRALCRTCAGVAYYRPSASSPEPDAVHLNGET